MDKYIAGKGRNRSQRPKSVLGFARRFLASAVPEIATSETVAPPPEPLRSARERRRQDGELFVDACLPIRKDQSLVRSVSDPAPDAFAHILAAARRDIRRVSPTGRLNVSTPEWQHFPSGRQPGRNTERLRQARDILQDATLSRVDRAATFALLYGMNPALLGIDLATTDDQTALSRMRIRGDGEFFIMDSLMQFRDPEEPPPLIDEAAELERKLAGRTIGQVIRRPRRTVAGIPVIDQISPSGDIDRKPLSLTEKE